MTDRLVDELLSKHYERLALRPRQTASTLAIGLSLGVVIMVLAVSLGDGLPSKPVNVSVGRETLAASTVSMAVHASVRKVAE